MPPRTYPFTYVAAVVASISVASFLYNTFNTTKHPNRKTTPSPLETYQSQHNASTNTQLAYPPNSFISGTRDVSTPYGSIRVYEFGSDDPSARKVILIHGISTPCISLLGVAEGLASKGCRVMLFDLFGRGWSDAPTDLPYDNRLYTTQILLALASSPFAWTGRDDGKGARGFSIIGYSLGGCIAADFTSYFPELVEDLVLIAPAGLQRLSNTGWKSKLLYSTGLLPEWLLSRLVKQRLRTNPIVKMPSVRGNGAGGKAEPRQSLTKDETTNVDAAINAELPEKGVIPDSASQRNIEPEGAVAFQLSHHKGFIHAFMSSIRNAPIHDQQARWALIGARMDAQKNNTHIFELGQVRRSGLRSGKVLIILGETDGIIIKDEVANDARAVLGEGNVEVKVVLGAGHEVAVSKAEEIVQSIWELWETA